MKLVIIGFVYFAVLFCNKKNISPFICFFIVFIVMAFQSNVPGDFYTYADNFVKYNRLKVNYDDIEIGWYWLNRLFGFSSFSFFYFFIVLFEIGILSKFTKKFVPRAYYLMPAILFFFDMNMMFFQMKGLRQALAIELGLLSIYVVGYNINVKNIAISLGLSMIAFLMHHTAIVVIVYVIVYILLSKSWILYKDIKLNSYWIPFAAVCLFYFISTSKALLIDRWQPVLLQLNLAGMEGYFGEMGTVEYSVLIDLIKGYLVFYVAYNLKFCYGMQRYITMLCLIGLYIDMFLFGMGNLFRVALYLTIFGIFVYPNVAKNLRRNNKKAESLLFVILSILYAYRTFVTISMRGAPDALDNYRFIFEL